jgi:quaternary ammonium compound-resistance protein SugE
MTSAITAWFALVLAGALEIAWALALKYSDGFTRFWPSLGTVAAIALSYVCMAVSLTVIPFGTAYAIWAGIGVAGAAAVGTIVFGEHADTARLVCLALIVVGIVGLKFAGSGA